MVDPLASAFVDTMEGAPEEAVQAAARRKALYRQDPEAVTLPQELAEPGAGVDVDAFMKGGEEVGGSEVDTPVVFPTPVSGAPSWANRYPDQVRRLLEQAAPVTMKLLLWHAAAESGKRKTVRFRLQSVNFACEALKVRVDGTWLHLVLPAGFGSFSFEPETRVELEVDGVAYSLAATGANVGDPEFPYVLMSFIVLGAKAEGEPNPEQEQEP